MSRFSSEELKKLAELSRLELSEEELTKFASQFETILEHMQVVKEVVAEKEILNSAPAYNVNYQREDKVMPGLSPEKALAAAPEVEDNQFVVPQILGEE